MSVTEILKAVENLSSDDQKRVIDALRSKQTDDDETMLRKQEILHHRLIEEGLLKGIPPRRKIKRNFKPVPIKGKPISETIIEDRI